MPRQKNTNKLILQEAKMLFAEKGYDKVTIADITKKVGCTPGAFYKHYKSKKDLYFNIVYKCVTGNEKTEIDKSNISEKNSEDIDDNINKLISDNMDSMRSVINDIKNNPDNYIEYINISEEEQISEMKDFLLQRIHNENEILKYKILMKLQSDNNETTGKYYNDYIDLLYQVSAAFHQLMMEKGMIKKMDPYIIAVIFVSPLYVYSELCLKHPEYEELALKQLEEHVKEFNAKYRI